MLNELTDNVDVYLVTGYSDMRKGIDGLATIIQGNLEMDPFSKSLFLFCGKNRSKIKGLLWEGDGFLLLYKRLDNGSFKWPRSETEARKLSKQQIRWLLEGLAIEQPKAIKESHPGIVY
jgi:transposase